MKNFLSTFAIVLILLYVFVFFGGWMLFDFSGHFWLSLVSVSFVAALLIYCLYSQADKIESLEKRIEALENEKNGAE